VDEFQKAGQERNIKGEAFEKGEKERISYQGPTKKRLSTCGTIEKQGETGGPELSA